MCEILLFIALIYTLFDKIPYVFIDSRKKTAFMLFKNVLNKYSKNVFLSSGKRYKAIKFEKRKHCIS